MGKRREAKEAAAAAAAAAVAAENMSGKQYVDAALREYKPRKGGTAKFKKGSKVLVPHTDQYYAAIVMQGQKRGEGQYYLLHYEGWSNKYDEWVAEKDVERYNRDLLEQSAAAAGNAPGDLSGRKRKADVAPDLPELAVEIPPQLRLHIPPLLKKVVLDDSEQVNLKGTLLPLPRSAHGRPTVNDILKEYEGTLKKEAAREAAREAKEAAKEGGADEEEGRDKKRREAATPDPQVAEAAREMVAGVRRYFDRCLHHFLLYSHEVAQADEVLGLMRPDGGAAGADGSPAACQPSSSGRGAGSRAAQASRPSPCDVYGAEHLVRLFVKLPELVPTAYMTPPDVVRLEQHLHDLMARMTEVKKQARFFSLPEEYKTNPHFNALMALHYQSLLGGMAGPVGGGTPGPQPGPLGGGALAAAAAAGGGTGPSKAGTASGAASEGAEEAADMEEDS